MIKLAFMNHGTYLAKPRQTSAYPSQFWQQLVHRRRWPRGISSFHQTSTSAFCSEYGTKPRRSRVVRRFQRGVCLNALLHPRRSRARYQAQGQDSDRQRGSIFEQAADMTRQASEVAGYVIGESASDGPLVGKDTKDFRMLRASRRKILLAE